MDALPWLSLKNTAKAHVVAVEGKLTRRDDFVEDKNQYKINSADLAIFSIFAVLLIKAGPIAQLVRAPDS